MNTPIFTSKINVSANNTLEIEFNNNNNLSTYGPKLWYIIHTFAARYTPDKRDEMIAFILSLKELIPCIRCRNHFKEHLPKINLMAYLQNSESLFMWSYLIHNEVNESKGVMSPSYNSIKSYYTMPIGITFFSKLFYVLFTFSSNYSPDQEIYFLSFIASIHKMLPSKHYQDILRDGLKTYSFKEWTSVSNLSNMPLSQASLQTKTLYWCYNLYKFFFESLNTETLQWEEIKNYYINMFDN